VVLTYVFYGLYPYFPKTYRPCVALAHKGASLEAPENTIAAFRRAIEIGIQGIELDARQTRDGEFVVRHDATLEETTNGKGNLDEFSLAELQKLDAIGPGGVQDKVPTLKQALQFLIGKVKVVMIELKKGDPLELVNLVRQEKEKGTYTNTTILFYTKTKHHEKLYKLVGPENFIESPKCTKIEPHISFDECISKCEYASTIVINWGDYSDEYVQACKKYGKKIMFNVIGDAKVEDVGSAIAVHSIDFVIGDNMSELTLYQHSYFV